MFDLLIVLVTGFVTPDYAIDARYPLVRIADAAEFNVSPEEARRAWELAHRHIIRHEDYLIERYAFGDVMVWKAEAEKCRNAWDCLDNVFRMRDTRESKLLELDRLRKIIGDDAYHARRMPQPTPGYMFRD